ncbi:unnamed protein product [Orchesella dallaii]|uniref:Uncharacterized protein n=1 Tax=Orchesella dallaii TaxID=48710 RepID=A0ABP1RTC4_9HEXA
MIRTMASYFKYIDENQVGLVDVPSFVFCLDFLIAYIPIYLVDVLLINLPFNCDLVKLLDIIDRTMCRAPKIVLHTKNYVKISFQKLNQRWRMTSLSWKILIVNLCIDVSITYKYIDNAYDTLKDEPMLSLYGILEWDNPVLDFTCWLVEAWLFIVCDFSWSFLFTFPPMLSCYLAECLNIMTSQKNSHHQTPMKTWTHFKKEYTALKLAFEGLTGSHWSVVLLFFYITSGIQQCSVAYYVFQALKEDEGLNSTMRVDLIDLMVDLNTLSSCIFKYMNKK